MSTVEQRGGVFRKGHLALIAAIPNAGKSAFAEALAATANLNTLYFSADQDAWTSTTRLISCVTGEETNRVALNLASGEGVGYYEDILEKSSIQFCFDSSPSLEDIAEELDAYVETWDEYPEVVVVDTLLNVVGEGDKASDTQILSELHWLARETKACVIVLVHASEAGIRDPYRPPPREKLINKVDALPDLVLMVAYDPNEENFYVSVGKTREGRNDPKSERPIAISADFSRMQFGVPKPAPSWGWDSER